MICSKARLEAEVRQVALRYGEANYDDEGFAWVHIPEFPLPRGLGKPHSEVLILLPGHYPQVGPDGWWMDRNIRGLAGRAHYGAHGNSDLVEKGWAWFCMYLQQGSAGGWRAAEAMEEGDTLLKFCILVESILLEQSRRPREEPRGGWPYDD